MWMNRGAFLALLTLAIVALGLATFQMGAKELGGAESVLASGQHEKAPGADAALRALLAEQTADWNRGDIDGFMRGYWHSPETTFAGPSGISRGWQNLMVHYIQSYPNRAAMGHLDFSEIEVMPLGNDAALILGRWHLNRDAEPVGGIFTLVARKFADGWRIIHDHTSTDDVKKPSSSE